MGLRWTAIGLKWLGAWVVLLVFGLFAGPSPVKGAVMAFVVAAFSWMADRMLPFKVQGVTRVAIDGGLAALIVYLSQFIWPGTGINFPNALFAGFVIGTIELPIHMYLAARFGVRHPDDQKDGIR